MKKILLIDESDTYTWCLQKYLRHWGYSIKTVSNLKEARTAIQAVFTTTLIRFSAKTRWETPAYAKNSPIWQMAETPENQGFAAICQDT